MADTNKWSYNYSGINYSDFWSSCNSQQKQKSDHMLCCKWWLAIYYILHLKIIDPVISIQNVVLQELQKPQYVSMQVT